VNRCVIGVFLSSGVSMQISKITNILRSSRGERILSIEKAILAVEEAAGEVIEIESSLYDSFDENRIFLSRECSSITRSELRNRSGVDAEYRKDWIIIEENVRNHSIADRSRESNLIRMPVNIQDEQRGEFIFISPGPDITLDEKEFLQELIRTVFSPDAGFLKTGDIDDPSDDMKGRLFSGAEDDIIMKQVLAEMAERAGAEFCAYYSAEADINLHILLASRELSVRIPEIKSKLIKTFRMYSNRSNEKKSCREKIYLKSDENNIAYLVGDSKIKSYFLVPVISDLKVRGTLLLGSIRDDAFVREDIEYFKNMTDREDSGGPVVYRMGGQLGILMRLDSRERSAIE